MSLSAFMKRNVADLSARSLMATSGPPPVICFAAIARCGWSGAAGIDHAFDLGALRQPIGELGRARGVPLDAQAQGFEPLQQHPGVERAHRRAGHPQEILEIFLDELSARANHAAKAAPLAVDVLRRGIDHHVRAQPQRLLQHGRGEYVVHHEERARLLGDSGGACQIDKVQQRVSRAFAEQDARVLAHRAAPLAGIAPVYERR